METRRDTLERFLRPHVRAVRDGAVRAGRRAGPELRELGVPGVLLLALFGLAIFAAFSSGGIGSVAEGRVHIAAAVLLVATGIAWGAGQLEVVRMPLAWAGAVGLIALAAWMLAGVGTSPLPDDTWIASNRAAAYAVVVGIALLVAGSARRAPQVAVAGLVAVGVLIALYALAGKVVPALGFDHAAEFPRLRAPIGYANGLGLLLVLPIGAYLWGASDRRFPVALRVAALCALVLALVAAGLTLSRGALLAGAAIALIAIAGSRDPGTRTLLAALAVLAAIPPLAFGYSADSLNTAFTPLGERTGDGAILGLILVMSIAGTAILASAAWRVAHVPRFQPPRPGRRAVAAVAAMAILGTAVTAILEPDVPLQRVGPTEASVAGPPTGAERLVAGDDSNRLDWWGEAVRGWTERPLAGWGAGSFLVVHRLYRDAVVGVRQPHSLPLQFLVETGLIGLALATAALGLLLVAATRRTLAARDAERSARLALLAAAVGWTAHGFVDWGWDLPGVTLPALLALAVAAAPSRESLPGPGPPGGGRLGVLGIPAAAALGALALVVSAGMPMLAEGERREALSTASEAAGNPDELEQAAEHAAMARRLNPLSLEAVFAASEIANARGIDTDYLAYAVEGARLQPMNLNAWLRLLRVQMHVGDHRYIDHTVEAIATTDPMFARAGVAEGLVLLVTPPTLSPTAGGTPLGTVEVPRE